MEELKEFRFYDRKSGKLEPVRWEKRKDLPSGLSPEEYGDWYYPERRVAKPPALPEPMTVTELWQRCRPVLGELVKEAWSPLKKFPAVTEFLDRLEGQADRIRHLMATSPYSSNPTRLGQGTKLLEAVVRLLEEAKDLAETRGVVGSQRRCPERDARWTEVRRLAKAVVAAEAALAAVEESIVEEGPPKNVTAERQAGNEPCRRKRGRPRGPAGDARLRKRVCAAWKSGRYKTKRELAKAFLPELVEGPSSPEQHEAALCKATCLVRLMIDSGRKSGDLGKK